MPDVELDAVVRTTVFGRPDAKTRAFSCSWAGLGRITEYLNHRGYSLHCNAFAPAHLVWLNSQPGILSSGERYRPAEVRVVDIYKRQGRCHFSKTISAIHVDYSRFWLSYSCAILVKVGCSTRQFVEVDFSR